MLVESAACIAHNVKCKAEISEQMDNETRTQKRQLSNRVRHDEVLSAKSSDGRDVSIRLLNKKEKAGTTSNVRMYECFSLSCVLKRNI